MPPAQEPADFSGVLPIANTSLMLLLAALVEKVAWLGPDFAVTDIS